MGTNKLKYFSNNSEKKDQTFDKSNAIGKTVISKKSKQPYKVKEVYALEGILVFRCERISDGAIVDLLRKDIEIIQ